MWNYIFALLILANFSVWYFVSTFPDDKLHIVACDVGQGDGYLIYHKTTQLIVDGGPGNNLKKCLDKHIPVWDRTIEMVINTHPQLDHYEGLISVLENYNVQIFTANSLKADAPEYGVLKSEVESKGVKVVNPTEYTRMAAKLFEIDILHPSPQFLAENLDSYRNRETPVLSAYGSALDPNDFSVVFKFHYKEFDALFTGDINETVIKLLEDKGVLDDIEYLKVPHHGSKNGLTQELLTTTTPEIAVISNGKKNTYGHPHKETLDLLSKYNIKTYRTDEMGDVEVVTDGKRYWVKE